MRSWSGLSMVCLRLNFEEKKTQERIPHTEAKKQRPKLSQRVIVSEIQRENSHINTRNKKEERIDKGRTPSVD
jgi:hypothetical protein